MGELVVRLSAYIYARKTSRANAEVRERSEKEKKMSRVRK